MNQGISYEVSAVMPLARATGLFVSLCTIQAPTSGEAGLGPSGAPAGTYSDVSGLVDIPCMNAPQPPSEVKIGAKEVRASGEVESREVRHVLLSDYYPTLVLGYEGNEWLAVVTDPGQASIAYTICGAESDSQQTQTRLELERVNV